MQAVITPNESIAQNAYSNELRSKTFAVSFAENPLQWRHNEIDGVSIVYSIVCSGADERKKQSFASLAGQFLAPRANNAENVFIWWRYHASNANNW